MAHPGQIVAVFVFGAASLLLFSFAVGPERPSLADVLRRLPLARAVAVSTLTLSRELSDGDGAPRLEGLLLLPSDPRDLYYGKAIANWLRLSFLGIALIPIMVILYDAGTTQLRSCCDHPLGTAGLSAPGTLYAAITAQVKAKQTLLPLLLFPLIVPALLGSVKATSLVILGDPMEQSQSWIALLCAFDLIYWPLCGLLYGRVVEE